MEQGAASRSPACFSGAIVSDVVLLSAQYRIERCRDEGEGIHAPLHTGPHADRRSWSGYGAGVRRCVFGPLRRPGSDAGTGSALTALSEAEEGEGLEGKEEQQSGVHETKRKGEHEGKGKGEVNARRASDSSAQGHCYRDSDPDRNTHSYPNADGHGDSHRDRYGNCHAHTTTNRVPSGAGCE